MTIADHLEGLRADMPSCAIVAYADLSTGLVLAASTAEKTSQERLDQLCACASDTLHGSLYETVANTVMNRRKDKVDYAMNLTASVIEVYVGAQNDCDEALCLVCAPDVDIDDLVDRAKAVLSRIEAVH